MASSPFTSAKVDELLALLEQLKSHDDEARALAHRRVTDWTRIAGAVTEWSDATVTSLIARGERAAVAVGFAIVILGQLAEQHAPEILESLRAAGHERAADEIADAIGDEN